MDNNFILFTIEDAWKEFERGGEISNSADNLLSVVTELMERDRKRRENLDDFLFYLHQDLVRDACVVPCEDGYGKFVSTGGINGFVSRLKRGISDDSYCERWLTNLKRS